MKNIYITSGTEHYLRQVLADHPNEPLILLQNYSNAVLIEESKNPTVLKEASTYRLMQSYGEIKGFGSVTFEYIMVRDEEIPIFLKMYQNIAAILADTAGLQCVQLGQSVTQNKYLILTFWDSERYYQAWKTTPHHAQVIKVMENNNTQIGFSHIDTYHFPEFSHDSK
ncbi:MULTISPECIES: antibiotic biosynthesis monooxygenase [Listeria]|uniref:antibiotic biosynthesis monooxygenase family protein n=1 Tax=Listeria TaxID=1637 RepID=UPI000B58D424|nr:MULTISPECIES: antibiotic biosynthesis monooxygenase [Listeria]